MTNPLPHTSPEDSAALAPLLAPAIRPVPRWFDLATVWALRLLRPILPARALAWLQHVAWFIAVGVFNTLLGYVVFILLVHVGLSAPVALTLGYMLSILISYLNFSRYVFHGGNGRALVRFFAAYLLLYLCNLGLLAALQAWVSWSVELSQLVLLPLIAALSYLLNRWLIFGKTF